MTMKEVRVKAETLMSCWREMVLALFIQEGQESVQESNPSIVQMEDELGTEIGWEGVQTYQYKRPRHIIVLRFQMPNEEPQENRHNH